MSDILKSLENKAKGRLNLSLRGEYQTVCPIDQTIDYGRFRISYSPRAKLVETGSLVAYMQSYKGVKILNEELVEKIVADFVAAIEPAYVEVVLNVMPGHGGVRFRLEAWWGVRPAAIAA